MINDTDFSGQVVLITGGASGIGYACAEGFAKRGAKVAIADLKAEQAEAAAAQLGDGHIGLGGDVSSEEVADQLVSDTVDKLGRLDVLINCAGMSDSFLPTVEQSGENFSRLIDVHLTGSFLMAKRAAREMIKAGHGAIINISSIAGTHALVRRNAYTSAKHAVIGLTKTLGCEWAQDGVRVNAIAPGYIETPMVMSLVESGRLDANVIKRRTPMGIMLKPEEIANAAIFLACPLSKAITGTVVTVDGGYTSYGSPADAAEVD